MSNIKSKVNGHNKKMLPPKTIEPQNLCNCLIKENFPMNEICLKSSILCQATIKCSDIKYKQKRCKGICETTLKKCYINHRKSLNVIKSKNDGTLFDKCLAITSCWQIVKPLSFFCSMEIWSNPEAGLQTHGFVNRNLLYYKSWKQNQKISNIAVFWSEH